MKKIFIPVCFILIVIAGFWIYSFISYPTTSPINVIRYFIQSKTNPHKKMNQQTLAFLPYWRMGDLKYARFDLLSGINYFSLTADKDGNFVKVTGTETEPGWRWWNSQVIKDFIAKTQINGGKFTLTIAMQKNKTIETFLNNKQSQQALITNLIEQIESRHLNGITIDFEYLGKVDDKYKNAFTDFSVSIKKRLNQETPNTTISLTLMPLTARDKGLFNLPKLSSIYDKFIGMSYDYYAANSEIAGPVAPMNGFKENKYYFDVTTTYQDYLKFIPKEKIVIGVPYYGWDWSVTDGRKIQSKTLPLDDPNNYAAVISYGRARESKDIKLNQCTWDDFAKAKWCWYKEEKKVEHQVWLEDDKSIEEKFNFASKNKFNGIAIWTLGYDKGYPDLWNLIERIFTIKANS